MTDTVSATEKKELWHLLEAQREQLIAFAQKLIRTPSLSGQEGELASLLEAEMKRLGYDQTWVDEVGNVVGRIAGEGGPAVMLNGHMDHVDTGSWDLWPHPPYAGEIHDNELWGRGAADMKGALAAMVYTGGLIKLLGASLPGDVYVTGVVQEEVGGLGAQHLARTLPASRVVIGEASGNSLRLGHRGRMEFIVRLDGRSVHASMPDLGINPLFATARFLDGLRGVEMAQDRTCGSSTVAPTRVVTEPQSANVTPCAVHLVLDWRNVPSEGAEHVLGKLEALLNRSLEAGCRGSIELNIAELVTYTGAKGTAASQPPFTTPATHPYVTKAQAALSAVLGRAVPVDAWRFATDGGHFAAAGATVLGFGPGNETVVHTIEERMPLDELAESAVGYAALCLA